MLNDELVLRLARKHFETACSGVIVASDRELLAFAAALLAEQAGDEIARRVAPQACPVHPGCGCDPAQGCGLEKARAA